MDNKIKVGGTNVDPTETERYLWKRRRSVLFLLVGIWGIYQFAVRDDFNPLWTIPSAVLVIVSVYNFSVANQKIRKRE